MFFSLVPRPSHSSVVCSSVMGEGLVKLITYNDVPGHWVDVWRSGTFLLYSYKEACEPKKCFQDCLILTAQSLYGPCLQSVAHSLTCSFSGMLHSSTHPPNFQVHHCM